MISFILLHVCQLAYGRANYRYIVSNMRQPVLEQTDIQTYDAIRAHLQCEYDQRQLYLYKTHLALILPWPLDRRTQKSVSPIILRATAQCDYKENSQT